jgi:hypothetical protein
LSKALLIRWLELTAATFYVRPLMVAEDAPISHFGGLPSLGIDTQWDHHFMISVLASPFMQQRVLDASQF